MKSLTNILSSKSSLIYSVLSSLQLSLHSLRDRASERTLNIFNSIKSTTISPPKTDFFLNREISVKTSSNINLVDQVKDFIKEKSFDFFKTEQTDQVKDLKKINAQLQEKIEQLESGEVLQRQEREISLLREMLLRPSRTFSVDAERDKN